MTKPLLIAGTTLALLASAACGRREQLAFPAGAQGPTTPVGAETPPTAAELVVPSSQARPRRSDELLRQSEERQSDEFDLPPT